MDIHNINIMDNLTLWAIPYANKISKKKITVESIWTYFNNKATSSIDNNSIIKALNQLQGEDLINQL